MKPITVKSVLLGLAISPLMLTPALAVGGAKPKAAETTQSTSTPTVDRVKADGKLIMCADPNNMPYAKSTPEPTGLDVEIASEIASELGVKLGHYWYAQNWGRRAVRQLREEKCDIFMGLPATKAFMQGSRSMIFTKPYYQGGFAIVKRKGSKVMSFDDIKDKKVGVQMVTAPDVLLSYEGIDRSLHRTVESAFQAVLDGTVDVSVLTGAAGGWLAKNHADKIEVLPNTREDFAYPVAIGVKKNHPDLLKAIDATLKKLKADGRIQKVLDKYNVIEVSVGGAKKKTEATPAPAETPKKEASAPAEEGLFGTTVVADKKNIKYGKMHYKQACYKCHGPNVISGNPGNVPDLRTSSSKISVEEFVGVVMAGRTSTNPSSTINMPAFGESGSVSYSLKEILQMWVYIAAQPKP